MTMSYYFNLFPITSSTLNLRFTLILYYLCLKCHFQTYMLSRLVFVEKKHSHQEIKGQHCHKI